MRLGLYRGSQPHHLPPLRAPAVGQAGASARHDDGAVRRPLRPHADVVGTGQALAQVSAALPIPAAGRHVRLRRGVVLPGRLPLYQLGGAPAQNAGAGARWVHVRLHLVDVARRDAGGGRPARAPLRPELRVPDPPREVLRASRDGREGSRAATRCRRAGARDPLRPQREARRPSRGGSGTRSSGRRAARADRPSPACRRASSTRQNRT